MHPKIKLAKKIVEAAFAQPLKKADVASRVGLKPSYFGRLFLKETGESFNHFVLGCRMQPARNRLLLDPTVPVKDVAVDVGYPHQHLSAFTRDFERYWGCSPSECRRRAT